jgi:hypothetical protein
VLHGLRAAGHGLDQRPEGHVEEHHLVFGVVGDVDDLVRMQPGVHGVQHAARAADAVVQLHVPVRVPGQRGGALARLHAQRLQRVGHPARARRDLTVGAAVDITFDTPRHDLLVAMVAFGMNEKRRDQQRQLHHLTEHG